jgi:hypothetical protein
VSDRDTTSLRVAGILDEAVRAAYGPRDVRERYDWDAWGDPSDRDLAECLFGPEDVPRLRALLETDHSTARDALINDALGRIGA